MEVKVYTDGACSGNPGLGGWGVVLLAVFNGEIVKKLTTSGASDGHTTNNRMKLTAAIKALTLIEAGAKIRIHTDSQYVINGITKYIKAWKKSGWKTARKTNVVNKDLWIELEILTKKHKSVTWEWVKGHNTNEYNNLADQLATSAIGKGY